MPTQASSFLHAKTPVPADLRTREWDVVEAWTRERAFFMAGVEDARILAAWQEAAARIAGGTLSEGEARKQLSALLRELDYKPLPGQEGTIKDLGGLRRFAVSPIPELVNQTLVFAIPAPAVGQTRLYIQFNHASGPSMSAWGFLE